jgi:hypothetical protein
MYKKKGRVTSAWLPLPERLSTACAELKTAEDTPLQARPLHDFSLPFNCRNLSGKKRLSNANMLFVYSFMSFSFVYSVKISSHSVKRSFSLNEIFNFP